MSVKIRVRLNALVLKRSARVRINAVARRASPQIHEAIIAAKSFNGIGRVRTFFRTSSVSFAEAGADFARRADCRYSRALHAAPDPLVRAALRREHG